MRSISNSSQIGPVVPTQINSPATITRQVRRVKAHTPTLPTQTICSTSCESSVRVFHFSACKARLAHFCPSLRLIPSKKSNQPCLESGRILRTPDLAMWLAQRISLLALLGQELNKRSPFDVKKKPKRGQIEDFNSFTVLIINAFY